MIHNCLDHNQTPLHVNDWVCYIDPTTGREQEGSITACNANNTVTIDTEEGIVTTNGTNVYFIE